MPIEESNYKKEMKLKTSKPLLWIGLVSITMFFAALTSAVVVSKGSSDWLEFEMPVEFLVSTIIILLSSFTYKWAISGAKKDNNQQLKTGIMATLVLGLAFFLSQFLGWNTLVEKGVFFSGIQASGSGSYLYALTGLHLAHLVGGLISLVVVYVKAIKNIYGSNNLLGLQLSSTYWHFLDGLWIYLFIFLTFIK